MVYVFYDSFLKRLRQTLDDPHQNPHYLKCPRCGEPWVGLMRHLILHHKLSHAEAKKVYAEAVPYGEKPDNALVREMKKTDEERLAKYLAYLESQVVPADDVVQENA